MMKRNPPTTDLKKGSLVSLRIPGHKGRRQYRVDQIKGEFVSLIEMWQKDEPGRRWVASKRVILVRPKELEDVQLVADKTPSASRDS